MAQVGSYVLSLREGQERRELDPKAEAARILRLFGSQPRTFVELLSASGLPEDFLKNVLDELRSQRLIEGPLERLSLTPLGHKAQYIVAA